jgi:hypothetical protein
VKDKDECLNPNDRCCLTCLWHYKKRDDLASRRAPQI